MLKRWTSDVDKPFSICIKCKSVIVLRETVALFLSTNYDNYKHLIVFQRLRAPPHLDLISKNFKSEERKNGL